MRKTLSSLLGAAALVVGVLPGVPTGPSPAAAATTWGPDVRIVYGYASDIWIAHPSGTNKVNLTSTPDVVETHPALSKDGRYVSYSRSGSSPPADAWVYDAATGEHRMLASPAGMTDFSPTEDSIAYTKYPEASYFWELKSVNVDGTTGHKTWLSITDPSHYPQWSADGSSLLYAGSAGTRMCRRSRNDGEYDDLFYAYRLFSVNGLGEVAQLAGDDQHQVLGGQEGGGVLAYLRWDLPASDPDGYCVSEPVNQYEVVVNGTVVGSAQPFPPSVNAAGDVAYASATGKVMVDPAGAAGPQELFTGAAPDWGVAYTVVRQPSTISLNFTNNPEIRANGQVTPNKAGQTVAISLHVDRGGDWVRVGRKTPTLSAMSRYVVKFARPSDWMCRLTARYGGDATHKPSSIQRKFSC